MKDADLELPDEFDAYIEAYVDEELEDDGAAAAYARFEAERQQLEVAPLRLGRAVVVATACAALAAGLLGVWTWSGRSLETDQHPDAAGLAPDVVEASGDEGRAVPLQPAPKRAIVRPEPKVAEPEVVVPPPKPEPEPVVQPPKPRPAERAPEASALARELEAIRALRRAARAGDHGRALSLARAHRENFDAPTLAAERDLIEIEALCGVGRIEDAAKARDAFAVTHATHHLRSKAEGMCKKERGPAQNREAPQHQEE